MVQVSASKALARRLNAQLKDRMVWTEAELEYIALAGRAADRAAQIQGILDAELSCDAPRAAVVARLSAELRLLERQQATLIAMLNPTGVGAAKSERHQRAALSRWNRERKWRDGTA